MIVATVLALSAAALHAGWNLAVKQAPTDRFTALWGQFAVAGLVSGIVLIVAAGTGSTLPAVGWLWAGASGVVHLPYCLLLSRSYDQGDFGVVYPIARGGGALVAGLGGVALLGDQLSTGSLGALALICTGLVLLAGSGTRRAAALAIGVAITIAVYSVIDAHGIRHSGTPLYAAAGFLGTATSTTLYAVIVGKRDEMTTALRAHWRRFTIVGCVAGCTYTLVQLALRRAPVGYVTGLRESSVVLAAFIGWRIGEGASARRIAACLIVVGGLVLLVALR
jgi:drug/metabolite transporter (DMT)-like permease